LNIPIGLYSSTLSIPSTNLRQVFLTLTQIKFSVANSYLELQAGQSTFINATAGTYNGITSTRAGTTNVVWANTGMVLNTPAVVTAEFYITIKMVRLESVGGRQAWSVNILSGSSNTSNVYSSGSGCLLMQTSGNTSLTTLRLLSNLGITTGYANLYVA
jgi:hypothetical protein